MVERAPASAVRVVSTIGSENEGALRRLRRRSVADALARYVAQTIGQPARLLDIERAGTVDGAARRRLVADAIEAFAQLPPTRLMTFGDRITLRADDFSAALLRAAEDTSWPDAILSAHRDLIGGSRGAVVRFARTDGSGDIEVFTTRPDTLFGATFVAVLPRHPIAQAADPARLGAFRAECHVAENDPNAKLGVPLGISVQHPFVLGRELPVWLANFVVEGYGTGAAGGCPACDQRDLDFARRYGLPTPSIICPPGQDPATTKLGAAAHPGDGTIINSGFLSLLPVAAAIDAAIARLIEIGRGEPRVQYRLRPLVIAHAAPASHGDVELFGRRWRFAEAFLNAAALVVAATAAAAPHMLHVTAAETVTGHLLDTRILRRALSEGRVVPCQEPWQEVVLVGDVLRASQDHAPEPPTAERDARRLSVLADTPPERDLLWTDNGYAAALRFVGGVRRMFGSECRAGAADRATLLRAVAKELATLQGALARRSTHTVVAAMRAIVGIAAERAGSQGLDASARQLVASLLYPLLPDLAAEGLAATGWRSDLPPPWPDITEPATDGGRVAVIVQIDGRKRGVVHVARGASEDLLVAAIRADDSLRAPLGEARIRRTIIVPDRLVNLVT